MLMIQILLQTKLLQSRSVFTPRASILPLCLLSIYLHCSWHRWSLPTLTISTCTYLLNSTSMILCRDIKNFSVTYSEEKGWKKMTYSVCLFNTNSSLSHLEVLSNVWWWVDCTLSLVIAHWLGRWGRIVTHH